MWFFRKTDFYELIHTFLDLKQLFLIFPLNFPNGVSIFTLVDIGKAKSEKIVSTKPSYKFDQYMALLWPLCPLNLNWWLFPSNWLQMIQIRGKNYKILKFRVLDFGFGLQIFFGLFLFFWGLWCLRSPVVCKNHIHMWVVFHPNQITNQNSHSSSLWYGDWRVKINQNNWFM